MNCGITRWKIVPSYRGPPCLVAPLTGFFQSLVPLANPMKLATPTGALSGNSVQVILPAVVYMHADCFEAAACVAVAAFAPVLGLAGALCLPEPVCASSVEPAM